MAMYRLAILEATNHKWIVYKIRYQRLKDRFTVDHFVGDVLGRQWDTLTSAADFAQQVHALLARIDFQQAVVADPHEDERIKLQSRSNITSLLRELTALTGVKHP